MGRDAACRVSCVYRNKRQGKEAASSRVSTLAARRKNVQDLPQFMPQVAHVEWLPHREGKSALVAFGLDFFPQLPACAGDGEPVFIEQLLDAQHRLHVAPAVHALTGAALHRFELRKLGLPKTEHVSVQPAKACDLADPEIQFVGNNDFRTPVLPGGGFRSGTHGLLTVADQTSVLAFLARLAGARQPLLVLTWKNGKTSEEVLFSGGLWGSSGRASCSLSVSFSWRLSSSLP